jgi:hypothetical protein
VKEIDGEKLAVSASASDSGGACVAGAGRDRVKLAVETSGLVRPRTDGSSRSLGESAVGANAAVGLKSALSETGFVTLRGAEGAGKSEKAMSLLSLSLSDAGRSAVGAVFGEGSTGKDGMASLVAAKPEDGRMRMKRSQRKWI